MDDPGPAIQSSQPKSDHHSGRISGTPRLWLRLRKWWPSVGRVLFVLAVLLLLLGWRVEDPLSLDQASTIINAKMIVARAYGAWHPKGFCLIGCLPRVDGRDQVLVVLFDDEYRRSHQVQPTTSDYAAVIRALAARGARFIFVDVRIATQRRMQDKSDTIQILIDAIQDARRTGARVAFAQAPKPGLHQDDTDCGDGQTRPSGELDPTIACAADGALLIAWQPDPGLEAITYPIWLSRHVVGDKAEDAADLLDMSPGAAAAVALAPTLPPRWHGLFGATPPDILVAWGIGRCADALPEPSLIERGLNMLMAMVFHPVSGDDCQYLDSISASPLIALADRNDLLGDPYRDRVQGRAVFVGWDINDRMLTTPGGLEMPGVFLHATAAENLLTGGPGGVLMESDGTEASLFGWSLPGEAILTMAVALWMEGASLVREKYLKRGRPKSPAPRSGASRLMLALKQDAKRRALAVTIWLLSAVVVCILALTLGPLVLRLGDANVLSVLVLVLIVEGLYEVLSKALKRVFHGKTH